MKECINCKTQLEDGELFCHECGTKQEVEEIAQTEDYVAAEEQYCVHCGKAIEADSAFCPFCGKQQDVEEVKDEEPQKEVEKEETQQETVEPESLQEPEEEAPQQKPVELEPLQEPEEEEPLQEAVEAEQTQTNEQGSIPLPQPESSEQSKQPEQPKPSEQSQAEETYEGEEKKKSKTWLWLLLAVLIIGGAAWYFFIQNSGNTLYEPQVDTDMIEEVADSVYDDEAMDDDMPTSAIEFLEQFYKGKVGDADYLAENVTTNVMIKLKEDYVYDCPSNDCLAVWVFTAYPPGSDLELEEGPIISETFTKDKYRVDFKYAFYHGTQQENEIRTVYLFVSELDGRYVISNYEFDANNNLSDIEEEETNVEGIDNKETVISDGKYFLTDGFLHLNLQKHNSDVKGDFYFYNGNYRSSDFKYSGHLGDDNMFKADVYYLDRNMGTIYGPFIGKELNLRVCLNNDDHNGTYKLKVQE